MRGVRLVPGNFDTEGLAQAKVRAAKRLTMPFWRLEDPKGGGRASRDRCYIGDRCRGLDHARRPSGGRLRAFPPGGMPDELTEAVLKFWQSTPR